MTVYQFLISLSKYFTLYSTERKGIPASNSELKRWIVKRSFSINGYTDNDPEEIVDYHIENDRFTSEIP
jgi:outer membrane lipoprotein-sorting protein